MQGIQNNCVRDDSECRFLALPAAIHAGRDLDALSIQGDAGLLDCVATFALLVDELGD